MDKYYLSLGRFVDQFTGAEDQVLHALIVESELEINVAQALFSGTRLRNAIDFIKRIHEAKGVASPQRLLEAFEQLATINTVRDNILHWGVMEFESQLVVTNFLRAHSDRTYREYAVSPEMLDNMTEDLGTIMDVLSLHLIHKLIPDLSEQELNSELMLETCADSQRPWLYKSAQQAGKPA